VAGFRRACGRGGRGRWPSTPTCPAGDRGAEVPAPLPGGRRLRVTITSGPRQVRAARWRGRLPVVAPRQGVRAGHEGRGAEHPRGGPRAPGPSSRRAPRPPTAAPPTNLEFPDPFLRAGVLVPRGGLHHQALTIPGCLSHELRTAAPGFSTSRRCAANAGPPSFPANVGAGGDGRMATPRTCSADPVSRRAAEVPGVVRSADPGSQLALRRRRGSTSWRSTGQALVVVEVKARDRHAVRAARLRSGQPGQSRPGFAGSRVQWLNAHGVRLRSGPHRRGRPWCTTAPAGFSVEHIRGRWGSRAAGSHVTRWPWSG